MEPSAAGGSRRRQEDVSGGGQRSPGPSARFAPPRPKWRPKSWPRHHFSGWPGRRRRACARRPRAETLQRQSVAGNGGPLVAKDTSSRATEALQAATQPRSPDGAREQLSQPQLPKIEGDHVSNLPPAERACGEPAPKRERPTPEATFTPTAAGLRPSQTQQIEITPQLIQMISEYIHRAIVTRVQEMWPAGSPAPVGTVPQRQPTAANNRRDLPVLPRPRPPASSIQGFFSDDEEEKEPMLSEDKGVAPDRPVFGKLFNPALFDTLLRKAKATVATSDPALGLSAPSRQPFRGNGSWPFESRRSHGDPNGTRHAKRHQRARAQSSPLSPPTVPEPHLQPPHTHPNRQCSHKDLYQSPRGHPLQVPHARSQALGGIGANQESTGGGSGLPTFSSPLTQKAMVFQLISLQALEDTTRQDRPQSGSSLLPSATIDPTNRLALEWRALKLANCSDQVIQTIQAARSPSTNRIYDSIWKTFCAWCSKASLDPLSISLARILEFLQAGLDEGLSPNTIRRQVAALSSVLFGEKMESLEQHPLVRRFIRGAVVISASRNQEADSSSQ